MWMYSFDRLVWVGGSEALCIVPDKDPVSRFVQHGAVVAARVTLAPQHQLAQLLVWNRFAMWVFSKYVTLLHLLLDPKPEYFFSWNSREQFLASRSWRFSTISFEKSIVVLLLEHQTFLELNSFFFSMSEIFIYKLDFFSMNIPWKCIYQINIK